MSVKRFRDDLMREISQNGGVSFASFQSGYVSRNTEAIIWINYSNGAHSEYRGFFAEQAKKIVFDKDTLEVL